VQEAGAEVCSAMLGVGRHDAGRGICGEQAMKHAHTTHTHRARVVSQIEGRVRWTWAARLAGWLGGASLQDKCMHAAGAPMQNGDKRMQVRVARAMPASIARTPGASKTRN